MKKIYLLATMFAVFALGASGQTLLDEGFEGSAQSTKLKLNTKSLATYAAKASAHGEAEDSKNVIVLIDEDFSGLTAGTEDQPDATNLVDDMGNFIDPSLLKPYSSKLGDKPWGGGGLYSAGGCIAIKDGWFLNTPAGDMSGNITITFRARIANGTGVDGKDALDVIFLSRKALVDYGRKKYSLTDQWQTFTYTADNGEFSYTGFQFMANINNTILIDDIRVTSEKTSIAAPVAQDAENATENGFTAVWQPTTEASSYQLSVYSKTENNEDVSVAEGFEGIKADADGVIDVTAPGYPEGWTIGWADAAMSHVGKGSDSKQSLRMIAEGDYITTPECKQGLSSLQFWVKPEVSQEEVPYGSYVQLSFDTDYGLYPFASIDMTDLLDEETKQKGFICNLDEALSMFDGVYSLKIEYFPAEGDNTTLLFDDFAYTYPAPPTLNYLLQDKEIKAEPLAEDEKFVKYSVSGLDPNLDYYYTVKAVNSEFTSEQSKEIEVFTVSQPTALEATNVTEDSYMANWTSNNKVDYYRVEQVQQNLITEDTDDYEILFEDFSKVTSDFKESDIADGFIEQGEYTSGYRPIDDLTLISGWKASSTQRVEGWLGGMAASGQSGEIAGAIMTPTIDLSHNDGECNVTVRAWGQEDDWLVIQGINAAAYSGIRFPKGGFVEATVTIPTCSAKESLTFYSNNYYPFLIDYIKITQNVKAGEKVSVTTAATHTVDATVKSLVIDNPNFGKDHDIYYRVTGLRYYHGDKKNVVASAPSELVLVKNPTTGITSARTDRDSAIKVAATNGGVVVFGVENTNVQVLTLSGQLAANKKIASGNNFFALPSGVYLVKVAGKTEKIVVK